MSVLHIQGLAHHFQINLFFCSMDFLNFNEEFLVTFPTVAQWY